LTKLKKRVTLFKGHYLQLRKEGVRLYGKDQSHLAYYSKYSKFNCFWWAVSNSRTHELDGRYRQW